MSIEGRKAKQELAQFILLKAFSHLHHMYVYTTQSEGIYRGLC